jgi:diguanylate cyclase (GGDEF)-like protein
MLGSYISIYAIDIIALFFLFALLQKESMISKHLKKSFTYSIFFTVLVVVSEFGNIAASQSYANIRFLNILFNVIGFSFTPIIPIVLIWVFDSKIINKFKLLLLPTFLNIIFVILSPWLGLIFKLDSLNGYDRGIFFILFVIVYVFNISLLVMTILYHCKKRFYPIKWKISALTAFTLFGTTIQLFIPDLYTSWHIVTLSLFILYILLIELENSFDAITGIYNRVTFEKTIKSLSIHKSFTVIAIDINNFKEINDTYGHDYGDNVLKEVSNVIKSNFDKQASAYRIGGDEFNLILRYIDKDRIEKELKSMANDIQQIHKNKSGLPLIAYGYHIYFGEGFSDIKEVFKEADKNMYFNKGIHIK